MSLGSAFDLKAFEVVRIPGIGLVISFNGVEQDSRCAKDVVCVWAGQAIVRLDVTATGAISQRLTVTIGADGKATAQSGNYLITVSDLKPYPVSTVKTDPKDYEMTVLVEHLTSAPTTTPTPTPSPVQEWNLEDIQVVGSTVTVLLRVYAGIDVRVTLDGNQADEVRPALPTIEYVFQDVPRGTYALEVRDVVGHKETLEVAVPALGVPDWLADLIQRMENEPVTNPPASVVQYEYKGQTVYYVPPRCCDIFGNLYDASGNLIGHPDGGITGQGDGRVPDFFKERKNETGVWKDKRPYDPSLVQTPAPIESVEVLIMESFPVKYALVVDSGLPESCISFGGYRLARDGDTIRVEMINWKPSDPGVACAEVYGAVKTTIPLGREFESGRTYAIVVNDVTEIFVAQ
ncbi:MAG: hypothetical protein Q8O40_06510 [Chloroflexota bacterium]|nr:hypothetical protein [Chloroflexota bacterium]